MLWLNQIKYSGKRYSGYLIEKVVGEGRYGVCFLAHSRFGLQVIIKRFKSSLIKKGKERIAIEAIILSQISHANIPEFIGVVHEKNFYGFVLELKTGDTVESMLFKQKHRFSYEEIFTVGSQLINIITYLHENGIIHGDIHPSNVLIENGVVNLIDFGLSRRVDYIHYTFDIDFSYLGDFLLYLLYSTHMPLTGKKCAWYNELNLSSDQNIFLKKLLRLEQPYDSITEVGYDFKRAFGRK